MKRSIIFLLITVSFVSSCQRKGPAGAAADERLRIEVSVDKLRLNPPIFSPFFLIDLASKLGYYLNLF